MNRLEVLNRIRILRAENARLRAQNESMDNTLRVLEKELAGSGAPANSSRKGKIKESAQEHAASFMAKRNARRIKRAPENQGSLEEKTKRVVR